MNEVELVIFDMAGTTVEDRGEVPDAFAAALSEHGIQVSPEQLDAVRGSSKRQAVLNLVPEGPGREGRAAAVYDSFRERLAGRYRSDGVRAGAGAADTFRRLRERGVRVALNTGFDRETTALLLDALGWDSGVVDAVVCGDDVSRGRPAPYLIFRAMEAAGVSSVHVVANVGDTVLDLRAGHNAGVRWNVGVLSGAHGRAALEAAPHTHLLASVADLPVLWDEA
jgi:phosphonatase-like hydrolase